MNFVMSIISAIRNLKSELNISPKKEIEMVCRGKQQKTEIIEVSISNGVNISIEKSSVLGLVNNITTEKDK